MLRIDNVRTIAGVTVYGDDASDHTFYVLPDTPRFRQTDDGKPVFRFLKYRMPIDYGGGRKGGGYCFFDVEFTVDDATRTTVVQQLQQQVNALYPDGNAPQVVLGDITWEKGAAALNLMDSTGTLIEKVNNPASPSLFGRNITPFALEFTPEGATLFEQALQGQGGVVQVVYHLTGWVELPPITGYAWFHASEFYSFAQTIHVDSDVWGEDGYQETLREQFASSQAEGVHVDFGIGVDPQLQTQIRSMLQKSLETAIEKKMLDQIKPVADNQRGDSGDEDVSRNFQTTKVEDFSINYAENDAHEWDFNPQGTLPNITTLHGSDGQPLNWNDYAVTVDLDDPFFKQLNVSVQVNADFAGLPINSVDVHLEYVQGATTTVNDYHFTSPDQVNRFASYIENNIWQYSYHYTVNYKDESKTLLSPTVTTNSKVLTINVDDLGVLTVDVLAGNLDFTKVASAQVTISYQDSESGTIAEEFVIDKNHTSARYQHILFHPAANPYTYAITYTMADGQTYQVSPTPGDGRQVYVNSPFSATRVVGLRAAGDLDAVIDTIFVDVVYTDSAHNYSQQNSFALSKTNPFANWPVPVIDPRAGSVTYSGSIRRKDGSVESIPSTTATGNTILVGEVVSSFLAVSVVPDLVDFTKTALVKVELHYTDPANGLDESTDLILRKGAAAPAPWKVALKDSTKSSFTWKATYYAADGSQHVLGPTTATDPTIVLPATAP